MSKKSRSRTWFLVHSWLALPIWFFVFLVCATGTLAVLSEEIIWLANPDVRATRPTDDAPLLGYDQIVAAIARQQPDAAIEWLARPDEDHFALSAAVSYPDTRTATLYVNPYTGVIQGSSPLFDFRQFTRALHGWWLVPFTNGYSWGWYLVSLLGLPMLASLVTGLVVYKRFWRGFLRPTLRIRQGARIFWGDVHRLAGIWSIWFIAVIAITGTWFLISAVLYDNHIALSSAGPPTLIAREALPRPEPGQPMPRIGVDQAVEMATRTIPGFEVSFVGFPPDAFTPLEVGGRGAYPLIFQTAEVNPYDGTLLSAHLLSDRNALELLTESMRPLHTGDFGGIWLKLVWFFFGLLLTLMVLSGLLIWSKRTVLATAKAMKRPPRPRPVPRPATEVTE